MRYSMRHCRQTHAAFQCAKCKKKKKKAHECGHSKWDSTNKGASTKTFLPTIKDRLTKQLQLNLNQSTVVTGHGKLRSCLYRFKIIDDPTCPCQMGFQSTEHLIREYTILNKGTLKNGITNEGGS
jgi:hypothetical protein